MSDETKKYLIDIESNLKKYADEAVEAKKKVDELKAANEALMQSGKASAAEIEASKAALKNANAEYAKAQKMVQLQVAANSSEAGSRKQLGEILKLQEQELGKLGKAYITNAQGVRELNPLYIEQRKRIAETKQAIIDYDLTLNDGRSNVGRYGESVKEAFAGAGKSILSMVSPMALVTAGIATAKKLFDGLKEAIMSTTFAIDAMNQVQAVSKQLFYDIAINGQINIANLKESTKIQGGLNALRIKEAFETLELSKINREEQAVRERSIDRTRTHTQRLEDLEKVKELESAKTKILVGNLTDELKLKERLFAQQPANEKLGMEIIALRAKINDTYAAEDQAMRRVETQRTGFIQEAIDDRKKAMDAYLKEIEEANEKQDKKAEERIEKKRKQEIEAEKEAQSFVDKELARMDKDAEDKWNKEVEFQRVLFEQNRKAGQEEYDARIAQEKALADAVLQIHESMNDSKIRIATAATDFLNSISGENRALQNASIIADKALAIAEVVIQTTKANATIRAMAAASVLPGPGYLARLGIAMAAAQAPINLNRIAAAADIASIIAAAAMQLKSAAQSNTSSFSAPTSISSYAQRTFANPVGSTILTQPQLTQNQLNTIPNQNILTAEDIADALSKIPAPVVTVEDINAKIKESNKVSVRGNI